MLLSEIRSTFPRKAGEATLVLDPETMTPSRDGATITIPDIPGVEFFPLKRGRQFLLRASDGRCWFGGTDEAPFLTQVAAQAYRMFQENGAKGFFAALKPRNIAKLERLFGARAGRQGDIWYLPFAPSWPAVKKFLAIDTALFRSDSQQYETWKVRRAFVFGTNHRITGMMCDDHPMNNDILIASGTLEADDHAPVTLRRPHVLAQTANLVNPDNAD